MLVLLMKRTFVLNVKKLLQEQGVGLSARTLLTSWMISRFPETIQNSPDESLKRAADLVVEKCREGLYVSESLSRFAVLLENWKQKDKRNLEEQMGRTRKALSDITFSDRENQKVVDGMVETLDAQAKRSGIPSLEKVN